MNEEMLTQKKGKLILTAILLVVGVVFTFVTVVLMRYEYFVNVQLLLMHIPVLLCGLICGWQYGGAVGVVLTLVRHVLIGMFGSYYNYGYVSSTIPMLFELAAYGIIAGALYARSCPQNVAVLFRSLIIAMIGGRLVWGAVWAIEVNLAYNSDIFFYYTGGVGRIILYSISYVIGPEFREIFLNSKFLNVIPGIILQLVAIPAIMIGLDKAGILPFRREDSQTAPTVEN